MSLVCSRRACIWRLTGWVESTRTRRVGWRERDFARFNDDERRALFGGRRRGALPPSDEGRAHSFAPRPSPRLPRSRSRRSTSPATLLAVAISGAAIIFAGYMANVPGLRDLLDPHIHSPVAAPQPPGSAPQPIGGTAPASAVDPSLIRIRWRSSDLAPAAAAGRICVTDARHGRICASYVVGERPADTLTRRVESLGYRVQSSG
jgi:hypothetical protein